MSIRMPTTIIAPLLLWKLTLFLLSGFAPGVRAAGDSPPGKPVAWYRHDGLEVCGAEVAAWNAAGGEPSRALTKPVGTPRAWRVQSPGGERVVLRLDGKSALWQTAGAWGSLGGDRTVVAFVRLSGGEGTLFDGSTASGMTRAEVRGGMWMAGVQPPPVGNAAAPGEATLEAKAGAWQTQAFVFRDTGAGTEITHRNGAGSKQVKSKARAPLSGFILGANVATQRGLTCDVAELLVYDRALDDAELKAAEGYLAAQWGTPVDLPEHQQPKPEALPDDPRIFRTTIRKQGDDGVHTYRIPGLATTPKGTLIAVFDARNKNGGDLPGDIDVGMMRSTDDGAMWGRMQRIMDYDATVPGSRGNGVGDPAVLVDGKSGHIFVVALWSKGARGWAGSGPGISPDETGQLVMVKSADDGLTWSAPVSLTPQLKKPDWRLLFNGPGNGIQLRDGTLVFAAQFKDAANVPHSCFIQSRDGGETWSISPAAIPVKPPTSEAQIAECNDGTLLLTMRNESKAGRRAWARWTSGKWSEPWLDVTDPTCMASLIMHPQSVLLFSNPDHAQRRIRLSLRTSRDDGRTWSAGKLLDPGVCMYSCMTVLRDGRIGILYESGDTAGLVFCRFPLEWVLEK